MHVSNIATKRRVFGIAGLGFAAGALWWSAGLGAATSHKTFAPPSVNVPSDALYMDMRASTAISAHRPRVLRSWDFGNGLPANWETAPGVRVAVERGTVALTTTLGWNEPALHSQAVSLTPGSY